MKRPTEYERLSLMLQSLILQANVLQLLLVGKTNKLPPETESMLVGFQETAQAAIEGVSQYVGPNPEDN